MKKISLTLLSVLMLTAATDSHAMGWFSKPKSPSSPDVTLTDPIRIGEGVHKSNGRPFVKYKMTVEGEEKTFIVYTDEKGGRVWLNTAEASHSKSSGSVIRPSTDLESSEPVIKKKYTDVASSDDEGDKTHSIDSASEGEDDDAISGDESESSSESESDDADSGDESEADADKAGDKGAAKKEDSASEGEDDDAISGDESEADADKAGDKGDDKKGGAEVKDQEGFVTRACSFVSRNKAVFITVGASTCAAATTAYLTELYNKKHGKKVNKMQMAAAAWVATALVFGGYFYCTAATTEVAEV